MGRIPFPPADGRAVHIINIHKPVYRLLSHDPSTCTCW